MSASTKKQLQPYWNEQCEKNVSQLLSATGIDRFASASVSLNELSQESIGGSWCSIASRSLDVPSKDVTSWLSSCFPLRICDDAEVTSRHTKSILLKPTATQRQLLKQWLGSYRWAFNKTIDYKNEEYESTGKAGCYLFHRKSWTARMKAEATWLFNSCPSHVIYGAMIDADRAYKLMVAKRTKGHVASLPRCRRRSQRSCFLLGNAITARGIYPQSLGKLRTAEPLPEKPSDSRLVYEYGRWYLRYPYKQTVSVSENQGRVCSVDPGIRTFATVYSMDSLHKIGQNSFSRIFRLAISLDKLLSKASKASCRRRKRMRLAINNLRSRIHNLVNDMHYQTAAWLAKNYDTVVFPEADFTSAVRKAARKIRRKSVRSLMTWAFAKFRDRLSCKLKSLGKAIITVCESYTSKTANWSGEVIHNLGGRKFVTSAGHRVDRDTNGALGILLKALLAQPVQAAIVT